VAGAGVSRRRFLFDAAGALLAVSGAGLIRPGRVLAEEGGSVARWLARVQRLSMRVLRGQATTRAWRRRLPRLTHGVSVDAIRRAIDFDARSAALAGRDGPEPEERLLLERFPRLVPPGLERFAFTTILSHVREGFAVVPHGHRNMVSMHLVLAGALELRHYDRVRDEPSHLVIRPRTDRVCGPGDMTAISADRGNVHWFRGLSDSYALIVAAYDLDPAAGPSARDYVDPVGGESLADGSIRAPILTAEEARRRYLTF
jgi:hypothetical protein